MGAPSIPVPDFGSSPAVNFERPALPFGATSEASETVVLHVKILSADPAERLAIASMLMQQVQTQRIGAKGVTFLFTDENVTMALSDASPFVQKVAADVMKRLGIS